jgi:hypothetical protein
MDKAKALEEDTKALDTTKKCIYDDERCGKLKLCDKVKLCGDCGLDLYESEQYQESVDNFNLDRKIKLNR